jgi:hypothetical protein
MSLVTPAEKELLSSSQATESATLGVSKEHWAPFDYAVIQVLA